MASAALAPAAPGHLASGGLILTSAQPANGVGGPLRRSQASALPRAGAGSSGAPVGADPGIASAAAPTTALAVAGAAAALASARAARRSRRRHGRKVLCRSVVTEAPPTAEAAASSAASARPRSSPDFAKARGDFPALRQQVRPGVPLVYLDNAASSQKPVQVLAELDRFYREDNSNVHRGMHTLSIRATEAFESARQKVARFVNAADPEEVIFTRNATEAINLVAKTWARANVREGDEILLTVMEHHSNLVPWQILAEDVGATLRFVGLTPDGTLDVEAFERLLSPRTRLVCMCHVSNVLGCVNPVTWAAELAHEAGAKVLVDACQSVPHMPVDVQTLGADWLVASGHKMCGPTGVGFLWGRAELLRDAPPFLAGGEMIDEVHLEGSSYAELPHKFEAGTPAFAEAVALGAACDYLMDLTMDEIHRHEQELTRHLWNKLREEVPGIVLYGPPPELVPDRACLAAFNVEGLHAHDLATLVDQDKGVAIRAGHHCCQPLHKEYGITASGRMSAHFYNTTAEIDVGVAALRSAVELLQGDMSQFDMDLSALSAEDTSRPPTALEALQERGLIEKPLEDADAAVEAETLLGDAEGCTTVAVYLEPSTHDAGHLQLRHLPGLLLLRWCQLYGHGAVCVLATGAAAAEEAAYQACRSEIEQIFTLAGSAGPTVIEERAGLTGVSAWDLVREASQSSSAGHTPSEGASASSPAELLKPLVQGRSLMELARGLGVAVQAVDGDHWQGMLAGRSFAQHSLEGRGDTETQVPHALLLAPLALDDATGTEGSVGAEPLLSSPSHLHKRLLAVQDGEVAPLLRQLTMLPLKEVDDVVARAEEDEPRSAQRRLADEVVRLLHGDAALEGIVAESS